MGELAPEALPIASRVLLRQLLIPLTALVAYLFGWGLCQGLDAFCRSVFGTVEGGIGWIPFAGHFLEQKLTNIEHRVSSLVGGWAHHFENQFFTRWHAFGMLMRRWAAHIERDAHVTWRIAHEVAKLYGLLATGNIKALRAELDRLLKVQRHVTAPAIATIPKIRATTAPRSLTGEVRALEGELGHVIELDLPRLRARTRKIEDELGRLADKVRTSAKGIATTAFVGAVAIALGRLGAGWTRCSPWNKIGKEVCRTPLGNIEEIIGLLALSATTIDYQALVEEAQDIVGGAAEVLQEIAKT